MNPQQRLVVVPVKAAVKTKNYTYLIYDEISGDTVVVDPAGDMREYNEVITKQHLNLVAVLITHTHFDHVVLAEPMASLHGCRIVVSADEDLSCFAGAMSRVSILGADESFQIGAIKVTTIHTPGHTLGSTCFLLDNNLFTGDTLFIEGCGVCIGENSDPRLLFYSLRKLKSLLALNTKIFPGHSFGHIPGKPFSFLLENNIYLQFKNHESFVKFRMRKQQPALFNFR